MSKYAKYRSYIIRVLAQSTAFLLLSGCCGRDPSFTGLAPASPDSEWMAPKRTIAKFQHKVSMKRPQCPLPIPGKTLTMSDALDLALWNNPETSITWANARAASYAFESSESTLFPFIAHRETIVFTKETGNQSTTINSIDSAFGGSIGAGGTAQTFFETLITDLFISYLITDFGGRLADIEAARQALYQANWLHNRELQTVVFDTLQAVYAYHGDAAKYVAQLSDLEDAEMTLDAAQQMKTVGVKTIADVLQAQSSLAKVQLEVEKAYGAMKTAMGKVARTLGLPADTEVKLEQLPEDLPADQLSESIEQLMTAAQMQRPDLAAAYAVVQEKQANLKSAQSSSLPQLGFIAGLERDTSLIDSLLNSTSYNAALQLNVPIFRGFYYRNQIRKAKEEIRLALAEMWSKEYDIYLQVLEAYYEYQTALTNIAFSKDFLMYSKQNYEVAFGNYKQGTGTILELLNAQDTLAQARREVIDAQMLWLTSIANIAYATGAVTCQF